MRLLAQDADLRKAFLNRQAPNDIVASKRAQAASKAEHRLVAYASECIAQGSYKLVNEEWDYPFTPRVQERFAQVGAMVDAQISDGPLAIPMRRALLQRAERFASFSPHFRSPDTTDDNLGIAKYLNEETTSRRLPLELLGRELGLRKVVSAYSGVDFSPEQAREFTDALGHLQQVLHEHVRTRDPILRDQVRSRVNWNLPGDVGRVAHRIEAELEKLGSDQTLLRFDAQQRVRYEREQRAADDSGFEHDKPERVGSRSIRPSGEPAEASSSALSGTKRTADAARIGQSTNEQSPLAPKRRRLGIEDGEPLALAREPTNRRETPEEYRRRTRRGGHSL